MMKNSIQSYKDLIVWQKAHLLAGKSIDACRKMRHTDESDAIKTQLIRSASSIPANIAEGFGGKKGGLSYKNYLVIARRSCCETGNWILLANKVSLLNQSDFFLLDNLTKQINTMLTRIILKL